MRRRFQVGHVFKRGRRVKVWVGCYREWVMDGGRKWYRTVEASVCARASANRFGQRRNRAQKQ